MNGRKPPHPFGRYIRRMREKAGLSQYYVAQQIDVRAQYLSQVELGERGPMTPERCESLARAIPGVNERDLWQLAIVSRPARLSLDPDHPDYALVLRLAEVISSQGELGPAQRIGILNILEASR